MYAKTYALTATVMSGLLSAGIASAQTQRTERNGQQVCPAGCAPTRATRPAPKSAARRTRPRQQTQATTRCARERAQVAECERKQAELAQQARLQGRQEGALATLSRVEDQRQLDAQRERELLDIIKRRDIEYETALRAQAMRTQQPTARGGGPQQGWRPHAIIGLEGGAGFMNNDGPGNVHSGIGGAVHTGGSWGARAGVELFDWFTLEGRYLGMFNDGRNGIVPNNVGLLTNSALTVARLTLPIRFIRPYFFGGIGGYWTNVTGDFAARQASTLLNTGSFGVPVGAGLEVPIGEHFRIGAEATYHVLFNERFSTNQRYAPGDLATLNGVLQFRM